jgi:hypothetical protein
VGEIHFHVGDSSTGTIGLRGSAIACSNPDCTKTAVSITIAKTSLALGNRYFNDPTELVLEQRLLPSSYAKPQPEFIPAALREDYLEACAIRDLSPKASATLARRCLQGMIRDFAKIKERSLYHEIEKLRSLAEEDAAPKGVSDDSIESLHHVRSLGNIGAHMEKDIDVIIPVDPSEAQILIDLVESLFDEWYVQRHKRQARFSALRETAEQKQALKVAPLSDVSD